MRVTLLNPPSKYAKNVVRDLVYGCWCKGKRIASASFPPTTLLSVATVLEKNGHDVRLLDSQAEGKTIEQVQQILSKENPEIIIIPTSTSTYKEDSENLRKIKQEIDVTTIAYGSHVTFRPKDSSKIEGIDYFAMREPEYIIRDFVTLFEKGKNYKNIKGLAFRNNGSIKINPPYPFIDPLDKLPIPNRESIKDYVYYNPLVKKIPWTTIITSRGCPARCNFCTSPFFYGKVFRMQTAKRVVDEMEHLVDIGYKEIFFRDETFTANRQRVVDICNEIQKRELEVYWICNARIGNVNKELMQMMKDAGCHLIKFGVESGNQEILNNINKGITVEMIRQQFKIAHEVGMQTHAHTMIGCIGESWETVEQTIKFLKEIEPTTLTCGVYTPYPGTPLFEMVEKQIPTIGDGTQIDLTKLHTYGFHNSLFCDLTDEELRTALKKVYKSFYMRPSYILRRLAGVNSLDELRRLVTAGIDVITFSLGAGD